MNGAVLRILDANANRAREALRVIEDYARFVLDDRELCSALKQLRHDFADATASFVSDAIYHRDTPGDVGTSTKTQTELQREGASDVVTAAGKRLGEALRTIEEYLKTINSADAAKVESIRYRFYDIERRIALSLRPLACAFAERVRLYVLITQSVCNRPWLETAEQAILGGADCLQLREKDLDDVELLARARLLTALCRRHNSISIINDRPDITLLSGADGVHLGQDDLPVTEVRKLMGSKKIIGVSTNTIEQSRAAVSGGADYIGVGPIFVSGTKRRDFVSGLEFARQVMREIHIPAVAIAGISESNVDEVLATGIQAIAVTAAVAGADDPRRAAERLKEKLTRQATRASTGSAHPA